MSKWVCCACVYVCVCVCVCVCDKEVSSVLLPPQKKSVCHFKIPCIKQTADVHYICLRLFDFDSIHWYLSLYINIIMTCVYVILMWENEDSYWDTVFCKCFVQVAIVFKDRLFLIMMTERGRNNSLCRPNWRKTAKNGQKRHIFSSNLR